MRILLLTHSFNSLAQRLHVELTGLGHLVSVEFDINVAVTREAVLRAIGKRPFPVQIMGAGAMINGMVVQEAPLVDGDAIQIGPAVQLTFTLAPAGQDIAAISASLADTPIAATLLPRFARLVRDARIPPCI